MAQFVVAASKGTDDPTMATLAFIAAKAAKEQGHDVILWLQGEAVVLAREGVANGVIGIGLPPLNDIVGAVQAAGIPIWVCSACAEARQIHVADLISSSLVKGMPDFVKAVAESDKSLSF